MGQVQIAGEDEAKVTSARVKGFSLVAGAPARLDAPLDCKYPRATYEHFRHDSLGVYEQVHHGEHLLQYDSLVAYEFLRHDDPLQHDSSVAYVPLRQGDLLQHDDLLVADENLCHPNDGGNDL